MKTFEINSQAFFVFIVGGVRIHTDEANRNGRGATHKKVQFKHPIKQNGRKGGKNYGKRWNE